MEGKLFWEARRSPRESASLPRSSFRALLPEMTRSAPTSSAACRSISERRLSLSDCTDTSAAMPRMMDDMKRKSLERFRRLSRHAILNSHDTDGPEGLEEVII